MVRDIEDMQTQMQSLTDTRPICFGLLVKFPYHRSIKQQSLEHIMLIMNDKDNILTKNSLITIFQFQFTMLPNPNLLIIIINKSV